MSARDLGTRVDVASETKESERGSLHRAQVRCCSAVSQWSGGASLCVGVQK